MRSRPRPSRQGVALVLAGIGGVVAILLIVLLSGVLELVRAFGGLAVLVVPGFALGIVGRPAGAMRRLDLFLAAAGLSLSCVVVGGLLLNLFPIGLSRTSWLVVVAALLLATAVLARNHLPSRPSVTWDLPSPLHSLTLVAAVLVVALALVIARVGVRQPSEPYSAVWAVPAQAGMVEVGLDNAEAAATTYRIEVSIDGEAAASFPVVTIATGERWTTLVPEPDSGAGTVEVTVFLASRPGVVYRSARLALAEGTGAAPS